VLTRSGCPKYWGATVKSHGYKRGLVYGLASRHANQSSTEIDQVHGLMASSWLEKENEKKNPLSFQNHLDAAHCKRPTLSESH
jgi:hypothetical protein